MNSAKIFSVMILITLLAPSLIWAQSPFQAGINFSPGFPQDEFNENVDNIGLGLSGHLCYNIPRSLIFAGASFGFLIYGRETRKEPLSTTIPDVVVNVETTNNILLGHLLLRVQPPMQYGIIKPYVEGLFGFNYLWTETKVKDWDWDEDVISSKNYDDAAMSYGGGAGLMIQVYQGRKKESEDLYAININLGFRYLFGGEAEYLKKGDIRREDGNVTYSRSKSTTDLLNVNIGIVFNF